MYRTGRLPLRVLAIAVTALAVVAVAPAATEATAEPRAGSASTSSAKPATSAKKPAAKKPAAKKPAAKKPAAKKPATKKPAAKKSARGKGKGKGKAGAVAMGRRANMPPGWSWPPSRGMKQVGDACLAKLDELGVTWQKAPATRRIATPIVVPDMVFGGVEVTPTFRKPPFIMDCHLALGLETYGRNLYALGVRQIKFSSIYRFDTVTVNGQKRNTLSRHALGLAMDIRAFVDAAGNEARVLEDYPDGNGLLLDVEQYLNDSGGFRTVLTPRNDPDSHYDHYHIEIKVDYTVPVGRGKPNT
jgi:hypothetical protein